MSDTTNNAGPGQHKDLEAAKNEAVAAADEAESRARALTGQAKVEAEKIAAKARARAEEAIAEYRGRAVGEANRMASALRDASANMRDGSPQERAISHMADSMANAADAISGKDLGSIIGDINAFARRNPTAFIGGAALLGFAAARFAKASASDGYEEDFHYAGSYRPDPLPASRAPSTTSPAYAPGGSTGVTGTTAAGPESPAIKHGVS